MCERSNALLFPMQIIFEIFESLTSLYWHFALAPDAFFSTLVLK